ncbi:MAG: hypothetical protein ACJ8M1_00905 [Chthoniobacterales bacterium]
MRKKDRVQAHTAQYVNRGIEREATRRLARAAGQPPATLTRRINELEDEWDIERWLETNASALALTGTVLGIFVNRKFFAIPFIVLPFLFQHAVQGWCPPIPILRRRGVRTRREIDAEKFALKALRGDFAAVERNGDPQQAAQAAWQAANA